jgi:hypothetical protein
MRDLEQPAKGLQEALQSAGVSGNVALLELGVYGLLIRINAFTFCTGIITFMTGPSRRIEPSTLIGGPLGLVARPRLHTGLAAAGERGCGEPAQEAAGLNAPRPATAGSRRE